MVRLPFQDRREAGRSLASALPPEWRSAEALVLGLPRGGMPVAFELASALGCELDVFMVRKLGVPGYDELAMGAIAGGGVTVLNDDVVDALNIPAATIESVTARETAELDRRARAYRGDREATAMEGRIVILADDGLATGATVRAAARAARLSAPARLAITVPVAAAETCKELEAEADMVLCLATPDPFHAVGLWYRNFRPTTDDEVRALLDRARAGWGHTPDGRPYAPTKA
ncbi:MAG: phosphoribosyltransferase [Tepidiformaceae bacterium]